MKFRVDKNLFDTYSDLHLGLVVLTGVKCDKSSEEISDFLNHSVQEIHNRYEDYQDSTSLFSKWQDVFRKMDAPEGEKCSVHALVSRILSGDKIPHINSVVDFVNAVSLKYEFPLGAHDLDKVSGDIIVGFQDRGLPFTEIGKKEVIQIKKGSITYYDDKKVLTKNWCFRQCDEDKITLDSKNILIPIDVLDKKDVKKLKDLIVEVQKLAQVFFGGKAQSVILNKDKTEFEIPELENVSLEKEISNEEREIDELLKRGIENIYPSKYFLKRLLLTKKVTLYLGIDPTGPTLHLGHTISLLKLAEFQRLGHKTIMLIGDFTAQIGDPTDKKATRKVLNKEQVMDNCKVYKKQASKILRFTGDNSAVLQFNADWLSKLTFTDVVELASNFTVQQMLERDMFVKRMRESKPISLHEFFYPLMQGFDSVAMDVDGEIGGNDQTFNMLAGRTLMKKMKSNKDKFVMTVKILADSNGEKMGKTTGNMLTLNDSPEQMYGAVMSWTDGMIVNGLELCTVVPLSKIEEVKEQMKKGENPRDYKMYLAREIVKMYYTEKEAGLAEEAFVSTFQKKGVPMDILEYSFKEDKALLDILVELNIIASKGDGRRLVVQNAVKIGNQVLTDPLLLITKKDKGIVIKVGKQRFLKIV